MTNFNANNGLRMFGNRQLRIGDNARLRIGVQGSPATAAASSGLKIGNQSSSTIASAAAQSANSTKEFNKSVENSDNNSDTDSDSSAVTKDNIDEKVANAIKSDSQSQAINESKRGLLALSATLRNDFDNLVQTALAETKSGFSGTSTFADRAAEFNEELEKNGLGEFAVSENALEFLGDEGSAQAGEVDGDCNPILGSSGSQFDQIASRIDSQVQSLDLAGGTRESQLRRGFESQIAAPAKELAAGNANGGGIPTIGGAGIGGGVASPALGANLGAAITNRAQFQRAGQFDQTNALRQLPSLLKKV